MEVLSRQHKDSKHSREKAQEKAVQAKEYYEDASYQRGYQAAEYEGASYQQPEISSVPRRGFGKEGHELGGYQQASYEERGTEPAGHLPGNHPTKSSQAEQKQSSYPAALYGYGPTTKRRSGYYGRAREFVATFGSLLLEETDAIAWVGYAFASYSKERFETTLQYLLEVYAEEIVLDLSTTQDSHEELMFSVASLICKYSSSIARYFRRNATTRSGASPAESHLDETTNRSRLSEEVSLSNREAVQVTSYEAPVGDAETPESDDDVGDILVQEVAVDLDKIHSLLRGRLPFERLMVDMRRTFYFDEELKMEKIRNMVLRVVHSFGPPNYCPACRRDARPNISRHETPEPCISHTAAWYLAEFNMDWKPLDFMTSQYGPGRKCPKIGSVVTLSGSALYAYATTVAEYVQEVWPRTGSAVLDSLSRELERGKQVQATKNDGDTHSDAEPGMHLKFEIQPENHLRAIVYGTALEIVELAQLLSWLSAALNVSPRNSIEYCKTHSRAVGTTHQQSDSPIAFAITTQFEKLSPTENPCWLPLFSNAVIAHHFPIPERDQEPGLEIPIVLMAALSGARHAVEYQGGVVLKGYSTMLAPVQKSEDRVQWHLVSSTGEDEPLSYQDGIALFPCRVGLEQVSLDSLCNWRSIVGWCRTAATSLGTSDRHHYLNMDYSQAKDAQAHLNLAGGSMGFQQFGLAQLDFTLGPKEGKCHYQRSGPFRSIVSASEKTPVVLYDSTDRRAWLVPASDVMLHIAQNRSCLEPFTFDGKPVLFQRGGSAKETLLRNASLSLSDQESYCFRDMIMSIWSLLEYLIAQNVHQDQLPGKPIKATWQDTLFGFEFKAIVEERSPLRQKEVTLKKSNGGWPNLIQDIDALVLFANGFGDLIYPDDTGNDRSLCHSWRTAPHSQDYLVAPVRVLLDLYNVAGHRLDRKYLTSTRLQWHRGTSRLFEPCPTPHLFQCHCSRLQQIVSERAMGTVIAPGSLEEDGAVIFGASSGLSNITLPILAMDKTTADGANGLYSQMNQAFCLSEAESSLSKLSISEDTWPESRRCETRTEISMSALSNYSSRK